MTAKWIGVLLLFRIAVGVLPADWGPQLVLGLRATQGQYGDLKDPATIEKFIVSQVFKARLNDTFPTIPFFRANPSFDFYKLRSCPRVEVARCLRYGNATNGLPDQLQGIWWQDGVDFPEEAISPSGNWDAKKRVLTLQAFTPHSWAVHDTDSVLDSSGQFFLPSGAAHINFLITYEGRLQIYFNEDITLGQILSVPDAFYIPYIVPPLLVNWTMQLLPDGSWKRESSVLGIPNQSGNYLLRRIVDGKGRPGPFFDQWLKARGGRPFMYVDRKVAPPWG